MVRGRSEEPSTRSLAGATGEPRLVVIAGSTLTSHALPAAGAVVIGRDRGCEIRIDDPSISRRHARLRVDRELSVEDLGSSNGTQLRGQRLAAHAPAGLAYDEVVTFGAVGVLVQQRAPRRPDRTLWGHGYFELRLAEECTRAQRAGASFGLIRVRTSEPPPEGRDGGPRGAPPGRDDRDGRDGRDGASPAERLAGALREIDVVGTYAPGEWEVLVLDAGRDEAARVVAAIRAALPEARVALAMFPGDGSDAWALASAVTGALAPAPQVAAPPVLAALGPMQPLRALIERVALGDISVLILGETGVGKELVAEELHRRSPRAARPLVKLNCAALPEPLLESELFGHERGAFTGAVAAKPGLLEAADGGSVFLDEIGELAVATQAKLLRVIEQREILRVGAIQPRAIHVRFLSATHRDLEAAVADGRFREDLYFRLAGVTLSVPALRDRLGELDGLIARFAAATAAGLGRATPRVSAEARARLEAYRWPGNVRELRNVIERATLLCDGVIEPRHLPEDRMLRPAVGSAGAVAGAASGGLAGVRSQAAASEKQAIAEALAHCDGNQTAAARRLGISRRTLTNKLDQHGLARPRKRP